MTFTLDALLTQTQIPRREGVYYLSDPEPYAEAETRYWYVRAREVRLYTDEVVRGLPHIPADHPLAWEWAARHDSMSRMAEHLARQQRSLITLDLGCGNGWMGHQFAALPGVWVYGMDLNRRELTQAARVFADNLRVRFLYGDIFKAALPLRAFDVIILASVIQYFPDLPALLQRLQELLAPRGEIHLLDSPLYRPAEVAAAQERTRQYYASKGLTRYAPNYYHHTFDSLAPFHPRWMYDPNSLPYRVARWWWRHRVFSPFPWLRLAPDEV